MTSERLSAMLAMLLISSTGSTVRSPVGQAGQDCEGTCCDQAPMRSLPARPAGNLSGVLPRPTDRSIERHHGRSERGSSRPKQHTSIITVRAERVGAEEAPHVASPVGIVTVLAHEAI